MEINEELKQNLMERMDYSTEELDTFLSNPRNKKVLAKSLKLLRKTIIFDRASCFDFGLKCGG
jgi:hypothetical protein